MFKTLNNKTLDELNWSILRELHSNARISSTEIGRRVGLSAPAVSERIQKLEELGFILGYHARLDYDKLSLSIQAIIHFKSKPMNHDALMKLLNAFPEIIEWNTVTGNSTVILKVLTGTREELASLLIRSEEHGDTSTSLILQSQQNFVLPVNE